ncbi:response regulator transcription factor [Anaerocolumna xylanovorans]|uniref:Stage 0 sporulation protein A homolog n=1 Tax=Anaerocolumna xylanovorans DSM 12503 TaxID=1121345 RepID=A0A1M7XY13_9FIRM|nr:response regulator transcription factor [Anaerocolumna xylanovorans]SHO43853.1 DNA-binding response regulator, OmpR family, contains REC and winged-helix (wHTH) domain [Anaerocolumna xylanovorans DSM 12503]
MIKLYYVEDDYVIASAVQKYLKNKGYHVIIFETIEQTKKVLQTELPSLVLIDWNLTDGSGYNLCKWIRETWNELPIIFLTVKGDSKDIVQGFQGGADDYLIKPFDLEVLYARICAILRRAGNIAENYVTCGEISIDKIKLKVFISDEEIALSQTEYQLLKLLIENKGCILTRTGLLEVIWDANGNYVNDNTLTVTMKRLREKLHNPPYLKTIRSFGYRMEDV